MPEAGSPRIEAAGAPPALYRWATPLVLLAGAASAPAWLAAGPHLYDSGELVAACVELGGSHPPGQPLHALLAHAFARLPLGPIPARIALFSSACVLLAAFLLSRYTRALGRALGADTRAAELAAAAAAAAFVLAPPVLRQALRVEVYGLALCFTLWSALHLLRWARGLGTGQLWFAAFAAGVASAAHPPHALAAVLAGLGFVLARPALLRQRPVFALGPAALLACLGACAYAYLPVRSVAGAAMWGDPTSPAGFFAYVSAKAYAHNLSAEARLLPREIYEYAGHLLRVTAGLPLLAALAALLLRAPGDRPLASGALLASALALLAACIQPFEEKNPDNVAYLGPALALLLAAGAAALATVSATRPRARGAALAALLALPLAPALQRELPAIVRTDLPVLETLAGSLADTPPPRALVVTTSDFAAASMMQAKVVDGARPDTALFIAGLATSSWHWRTLARHPAFDGRPRRAPGADAHAQYLLGAILTGVPRIPVVLERDLPGGMPPATAGGPYALLDTHAPAGVAPGWLDGGLGERLDPVIAREARRGPGGDHEAGSAVVRDYQVQRARRLLRAERDAAALAALRAALWVLPERERRELVLGPTSPPAIALPPTVEDPNAFLLSVEDTVRVAAAASWALGRADAATRLLAAQAQRGDARALLQLAWLQFAGGEPAAARRSLDLFVRQAPQLAAEAAPLVRALAGE